MKKLDITGENKESIFALTAVIYFVLIVLASSPVVVLSLSLITVPSIWKFPEAT
jgi:hypothetical protein